MASNSTKNTYGNEDGNVRDLSPVSTGYNPLFGESRGSPGSPLALCYRPLRGLNTKSKRPNSRGHSPEDEKAAGEKAGAFPPIRRRSRTSDDPKAAHQTTKLQCPCSRATIRLC